MALTLDNKKTWIKFFFLGLFLYLLFFTATMPAHFAYGNWKKYLGKQAPVQISEIHGSIWSGKTGEALINGQQVQSIQWDMSVFSLLLGVIELRWEAKVKDGFAKGVAGYSIFGNIYLNNVEAWLPLAQVDRLLRLDYLRPAGELDLAISKLRIEDAAVVALDGDLTWHNAQMSLLNTLELGGVHVKFESVAEGVKGVLSDQGGALQAEGVLMLMPNKDFEFNGAFGTRGSAAQLQQALNTMGRRGRDGKVNVSQKGNLANFGF